MRVGDTVTRRAARRPCHVFDSRRGRARRSRPSTDRMQPLRSATFAGRDGRCVALRSSSAAGSARMFVLGRRPGPRAVPAARTACASRAPGRSRPAASTCRGRAATALDVSGFARPAFAVAESERRRHADDARRCACACALAPVRPSRWSSATTARAVLRPIGRRYAYQCERAQRHRPALHGARRTATATSASATRPGRSTSTAGACARSRSTRSATTRETSDPLYKHWPFLLGRDAAIGHRATASSTTRCADCTFDLGCEYDNYHGFYRYAEIDDGDLDYYLFAGPRIRDVVAQLRRSSPGGMAFGRRAGALGYANTAMSLADAPDAQAQLGANSSTVRRARRFRSRAFHFGSGYTQPRQAPLRVHLEPRQVSRSARR